MHTSFSGLFFMNTCPEYCLLSHISVEWWQLVNAIHNWDDGLIICECNSHGYDQGQWDSWYFVCKHSGIGWKWALKLDDVPSWKLSGMFPMWTLTENVFALPGAVGRSTYWSTGDSNSTCSCDVSASVPCSQVYSSFMGLLEEIHISRSWSMFCWQQRFGRMEVFASTITWTVLWLKNSIIWYINDSKG